MCEIGGDVVVCVRWVFVCGMPCGMWGYMCMSHSNTMLQKSTHNAPPPQKIILVQVTQNSLCFAILVLL